MANSQNATKQGEVSFGCCERELKTCHRIARRARDMLLEHRVDRPVLDIMMDVVATHCNGSPLRLGDLLAANDFNFLHDISGIAKHLNRETGQLENCFRPRFSLHG